MTEIQIRQLQAQIGTVPDGMWGPKSIAACQSHLRALMPAANPWPASDPVSLQKFYGAPGDESNLINLDVTLFDVRYFGKPIKTIRCHKKVAASLHRIIRDLSSPGMIGAPGILHQYAGSYNFRKMRGGTSYSLHAYGAAIDLDPATNGNRQHWPTDSTMPLVVMGAFAREGWLPAGAFWSRDAMHFQATQ